MLEFIGKESDIKSFCPNWLIILFMSVVWKSFTVLLEKSHNADDKVRCAQIEDSLKLAYLVLLLAIDKKLSM